MLYNSLLQNTISCARHHSGLQWDILQHSSQRVQSTVLTWSRAPVGESCGGCGGLVRDWAKLREGGEPGREISGGPTAYSQEDGTMMVVGLWLHSRSVKKHHPRCREKPVGLQLPRKHRINGQSQYCSFAMLQKLALHKLCCTIDSSICHLLITGHYFWIFKLPSSINSKKVKECVNC